jgi:hypothetical protein
VFIPEADFLGVGVREKPELFSDGSAALGSKVGGPELPGKEPKLGPVLNPARRDSKGDGKLSGNCWPTQLSISSMAS